MPEKQIIEINTDIVDVSDGYHTFTELYDHRITLFIALCKQIQEFVYPPGARNELKYGYSRVVWRSKRCFDKPEMEGWFIMGTGKEKGEQITYHLPIERWDETGFAENLFEAPPFDGHTSADVLERIKAL